MNDATTAKTAQLEPDVTASNKRGGWFAAGGMAGALLASSCCVAPLVLVMLGVSGAWIGNLTAPEPYKPLFAAVALLFIGLGFQRVLSGPGASARKGAIARGRDRR